MLTSTYENAALAQLVERLPSKQNVAGSNPVGRSKSEAGTMELSETKWDKTRTGAVVARVLLEADACPAVVIEGHGVDV